MDGVGWCWWLVWVLSVFLIPGLLVWTLVWVGGVGCWFSGVAGLLLLFPLWAVGVRVIGVEY